MSVALHDGLKAAYEDVAYIGRANPHTHPDRLAAIATLFGHTPPDPATARILEVGCGDGANLLPIAAQLPGARVVGCDYSTLLMDRARAMARGVGLDNVELVEGDLREIAGSLGTFDYIVAHGFYSWVPADVREAFVALAGRQLAPGGLAIVSYNVLPGCFVRRIGWDALRIALAGVDRPSERLAAARRTFADLAGAWSAMPGIPAHLAREFATAADRSDSSLYHDDLSAVNDAVYFSTFAQHVGRHGLGFLAEAELGTMSMAGLPERMRTLAASADPLSREQYLDFARLRRFRQSIVMRAADVARARISTDAVARLHLSAVTGIVQERAAGAARSVEGSMVDRLVDAYPCSVPATAILADLEARGMDVDAARQTLVRGCFSGALDLHTRPLAAVATAGERPRAFAVARWQAARGEAITSLRHEPVRVDDASARAVVAACDGTRDRRVLAQAAALTAADADAALTHVLERIALAGLLEA
jgi:SAM-dependent methyltransferase